MATVPLLSTPPRRNGIAPAESNKLSSPWMEGIQPFYDWMEQNHPEDLDLMPTDTHGGPQSDEIALELWALHTSDYVASMDG